MLIFLDFIWMFIGFILLTTCVFIDSINQPCNGFCCLRHDKVDWSEVDFQIEIMDKPVTTFTRNIALSKSHGPVPVPVFTIMKPLFQGLVTVGVQHNPIFNIARIALEVKQDYQSTANMVGALHHKNKYLVITLSGEKGSVEDLYFCIKMSTILARPHATLVMDMPNDESNAMSAWKKAVEEGIVHWDNKVYNYEASNSWVKGEYKDISVDRCVSQVILEVILEYLKVEPDEDIIYYVTSFEREDELRVAYKDDRSIKLMPTVTSAINAIVVYCMFPDIKINMPASNENDDPRYLKMRTFIQRYIVQ